MLDLRLPIGLFFLINATVLIATGIISPVATEVGASSLNLNLVWGIVMGLFGFLMLGLSKLDSQKKKS